MALLSLFWGLKLIINQFLYNDTNDSHSPVRQFRQGFHRKNTKTLRRQHLLFTSDSQQWELQQQFPDSLYPQLRFSGDARPRQVQTWLEGIDTVVHAAAPSKCRRQNITHQFINTNVLAEVVQACLDTDVKRVVALSTIKLLLRSTCAKSSAPTSCSSPPITSLAAAICVFQ